MPDVKAVVFDAYGTLLDVHSAMARHAARIGPEWPAISRDWRTKHIEYTWVRSLAGEGTSRDFGALAAEALDMVAAAHGLTDRAVLADILAAYRGLDAYPEVAETLRRLRAGGLPCAILSNGTPDMLRDAVQAAGIADLLDAVLSVTAAGIYKPDPRVYALATARFGCTPGEVAFVSSNAWDAYGAMRFGFRVYRVNRTGAPDEYGLRATAAGELADLSALPGLLSTDLRA
jgi:2-haloacid dehalogenase